MATGPEAWWAALWPQRRFDTNTSNDSFILAGFLSRRRHLHVYPLRSLNSPSCRIFVCRERSDPTQTKNGELICLLRDPKPCMQSRKSRCSQPKLANRPVLCRLPTPPVSLNNNTTTRHFHLLHLICNPAPLLRKHRITDHKLRQWIRPTQQTTRRLSLSSTSAVTVVSKSTPWATSCAHAARTPPSPRSATLRRALAETVSLQIHTSIARGHTAADNNNSRL